jgi:hypothetical protein
MERGGPRGVLKAPIQLAQLRWGSPVTASEVLQFEVIRTIAASLISVAIVLLWFVATSRQ